MPAALRALRGAALAAAGLLAACVGARDLPPAPGRMIAAGGIDVHVRHWGPEAGSGDGPDVLLIHGASSNMGEFEASLVPLLSQTYSLTAYDRPGMGRTADRPQGADTLAVQAGIAAAVAEAEGLDRPVVVAHSYGGAVALRLALDRPELISGLVLLGPVSHPWPGGVAWHYHAAANPLTGPVFNNLVVQALGESPARSGLEGAFAPRPVPEGYFEAARVGLALLPRALRANAEDVLALEGEVTAQAPRYGRIALPVAILAGDQDGVVSTDIHARALDREIPTTRLTVLEGVGHMPQHARPDLVEEMIGWVRSQPPAP